MNFLKLVLVNLARNKRRTLLTTLSVMVALFLFCALGGVLDTLAESIRFGSETRLVSRNAISLIFPLPLAYRDRIAAVPGVKSVSIQNWFGAQDPNNPHNFFAQFGVDAATFFPMYRDDMDVLAASPPQGAVGIYVLQLDHPDHAADVAKRVDEMFVNSSAATRTESERAFQAGFVSMYGNLPFVIRVIGLAVAFAILLVAANTMVMAIRERTSEIGVLKTLGFEDGTVFRIVLAEAAVITLGGGLLGALGAKFLVEGRTTGFLPPMSVYWSTVIIGIALAALVGAVSGLIPAWQASRLRIVDALRRVE